MVEWDQTYISLLNFMYVIINLSHKIMIELLENDIISQIWSIQETSIKFLAKFIPNGQNIAQKKNMPMKAKHVLSNTYFFKIFKTMYFQQCRVE